MRYEQLVMKMELPTWWLKFEDRAVEVIIIAGFGSIFLLCLFLCAEAVYGVASSFQETTSRDELESLVGMLTGFFAGVGIANTFGFAITGLLYVLEAIIRMGLRLTLLTPLLVLGLTLQLLFESIIGSCRATFVPLRTSASAEHNGS